MKTMSAVVCCVFLMMGCDAVDQLAEPPKVEGPPSELVVQSLDSSHVTLLWKNSDTPSGFVVESSTDQVTFQQAVTQSANVDTVTYFAPLDPGLSYVFRAREIVNGGLGTPSNTVRVHYRDAYFMAYLLPMGNDAYDMLDAYDGNGSTIIAQASDPNHAVYNDLAFYGDTLVVAGGFTSIGGVPAAGVAMWKGTWIAFGSGIPNRVPLTMTVKDKSIYVAVSPMESVSENTFVSEGSSFAPIASFSFSGGGEATSGAVVGNRVYFVFQTAQLDNAPQYTEVAIEAFEGQANVSVQQPAAMFLKQTVRTGIAEWSGSLYMTLSRFARYDPAPDTTMLRFDGASWTVADVSGSKRSTFGLVSWNGGLYTTIIDWDSTGDVAASSLAKWSGAQWVFEHSSSDFYYAIWSTPDGVLIGSRTDSSSVIERYDGMSWTTLRTFPEIVYVRRIVRKVSWVWEKP